MTVVWQTLFVIGAVAAAFWITGLTARRMSSRPRSPLPEGVVLVVGPGCRLCDEAELALRSTGAPVTIVDFRDKRLDALRLGTVPAALTVTSGEVVMRRVGRSVIDDAAELARSLSREG
ncbi:MAG: hypothetical protein KJO84_00860 [Acidimicrobiia bacterium]|nr:hypothetical protein [Acidimicrobiia bacterium]